MQKQLRTAEASYVQARLIPTDDPQAALRFCQLLSRLYDTHFADASSGNSYLAAAVKSLQHANEPVPELSVVIPVFNEEENIPVLYSRLITVLERIQIAFEIIFIDDGSNDATLAALQNLSAADERVQIVELARNFGHQVAISAGLDFTRGRAVAVMDADLQDPPEVLPDFVTKWRAGFDVVYAIRKRRKESWLKTTSYSAFYRILRRVASINIPLDAGDFCVMDRRVVDLLKSMPERSRFVRGIRSWVGLKQIGLPFERELRYAGKSKYSFGRLAILALDGLISFSYVPLRIITVLGLSVSLLSLLMAAFFFVKKLLYGLTPPGFASIIVSIFFLAGIQLITLGVIGEYVGRIFEEAKRRPLYILRRMPGSR